MGHNASALEFLRRPEATYQLLSTLGLGNPKINPDCSKQVESEAKYEGYIARQQAAVHKMQRLEERRIPSRFKYDEINGLRYEASQKLERFRPQTLGQASRIEGVTPADLSLLMVHIERARGIEVERPQKLA